jgi:hypothetical protein
MLHCYIKIRSVFVLAANHARQGFKYCLMPGTVFLTEKYTLVESTIFRNRRYLIVENVHIVRSEHMAAEGEPVAGTSTN